MSKSRKVRWVGHVAPMRKRMNVCRVLLGKRSLGSPWRKWVDNIKKDLAEVG
jgi:hypothetical protein